MSWAAARAEDLLCPLGDRWKHVSAVGRCAERIAGVVAAQDRDVLVAAAWLHDVGYAPSLATTGFHPLDGARWVALHARPWTTASRLAALVAHHSAAHVEAELRGLDAGLAAFPRERSLVADALAYCDMTCGPTGEPMTLDERIADIDDRYGTQHVVPKAVHRAEPELRASMARVEQRLKEQRLHEDQPVTS